MLWWLRLCSFGHRAHVSPRPVSAREPLRRKSRFRIEDLNRQGEQHADMTYARNRGGTSGIGRMSSVPAVRRERTPTAHRRLPLRFSTHRYKRLPNYTVFFRRLQAPGGRGSAIASLLCNLRR